jgi:transcriptional regulator with XRE-family HTH domain
MDAGDAGLLYEIHPTELGRRLRAARLAKGWTQTDLAGDLVSVGYVSRLESGQRRPNATVLAGLAARLDVPVDQLLRGESAREHDATKLAIDFAELALESGDFIEAEARARSARDQAIDRAFHDLLPRATFLIARALEVQGSIDDAILELEPLVEARDGGILRIKAAIALSRCLRESGDLNHAIDSAERVLHEVSGTALDGADESVQLAVTVAAAYYERGDTGQAVRTCRKAIDKAERIASPQARAAAYWNASMLEAERGAVRDAVALAERALVLLTEGQDGRNLARLRMELASMQLRLDPPEVSAATDHLDQADHELRQSSAGAIDLARVDLTRARAQLLNGDIGAAGSLAGTVYTAARDKAPIMAADAKSVEGQAWAAAGAIDQASQAYREAVMVLTGVGSDRNAAQLWFELAGLLETVGELDAARDAYRSAAASTGLRDRSLAVREQHVF